MNKIIKGVLTLGIIGIFSGFVLAVAYNYAKPKIEKNRKEAINEAVYNILPSTDNYETKTIGGKKIYFCYNPREELLGYTFKATGMGYQGKIVIMVGLDKNLKTLKGIEVLKHSETPGLGGKIVKESFKNQFEDLEIHPSIEYTTKTPEKSNQIQAITGATVTSSSVVEILNKNLHKVIEKIKNYNEKS